MNKQRSKDYRKRIDQALATPKFSIRRVVWRLTDLLGMWVFFIRFFGML